MDLTLTKFHLKSIFFLFLLLIMENQDKLLTDVMTAYMAQMSSALKISEIVRQHGDSDLLTADDIVSGLVYRLMTPMDDSELTESLEEGKQITKDLFNPDYESDDECETDDEYETDLNMSSEINCDEDGDKVILSRNLRKNNCNCDICMRVRVCLINYNTFEATDELAQKFKDAIDNTCTLHRITI